MCTAIALKRPFRLFGRTLDLEFSYGESVCIAPRKYPIEFSCGQRLDEHCAIIGMAHVAGGYPLYYDAMNEHGLAMAGLNFPGNAVYSAEAANVDNVAPYELILWVLTKCKAIPEVRELAKRLNIVDMPFSPSLGVAPLHWIIADSEEAIVLESTARGLCIYDNPAGVMTNNPPFDFMQNYIKLYRNLTAKPAENRFSADMPLPEFCVGMGAFGLPGDFSSPSRFVRAAFLAENSPAFEDRLSEVGHFFHIMDNVSMPRGAVELEGGKYDITQYSSCLDQRTGIYYYTTAKNRRISAVRLRGAELDTDKLAVYPTDSAQEINYIN